MKLSKANKDSLTIAKSKLFDKLSNDIEIPEVLQAMAIIPREFLFPIRMSIKRTGIFL